MLLSEGSSELEKRNRITTSRLGSPRRWRGRGSGGDRRSRDDDGVGTVYLRQVGSTLCGGC